MIEVNNLVKKYGAHTALNNVSFKVNDGEILGFLGPNGAGKSTTMNIITGYLSATSGSVTVSGYDIFNDPLEVKRRIGFLPEQPPLYTDMTVKEYLNFIYEMKKVRLPREAHIKEICRLVKIDDVYKRLIKNLSKGYRQRVGIAQALVGNPEVLILDEPTVGLDPKQIIDIRTLIRHLGKTHTVILSSHILSEVQASCERVIVINRGEIIADDTPDNLAKNLSGDNSLTVRVMGPKDEIEQVISTIDGIMNFECLGMREGDSYEFKIETRPHMDIRRELSEKMMENSWSIILMKYNELSLEEIFLQLTDSRRPKIKQKKDTESNAAAVRAKAAQTVNSMLGNRGKLVDDPDEKKGRRGSKK